MSPLINVNFDDVADSGFEVVPEDDYKLRITNHSMKEDTPSGSPNVTWICEIFGHKKADLNGKKIGLMTSFAPDALWKPKQLLKACNYQWDKRGFDPAKLHGKEFGAKLIIREWEGEDRMNAERFYPLKKA